MLETSCDPRWPLPWKRDKDIHISLQWSVPPLPGHSLYPHPTLNGREVTRECFLYVHFRGVDNFLGLGGGGGGANKVKTKELQFGSRGRVWKGDMSPPA